MLDLISAPAVRVQSGGALHRLSLPETLAALMRDEVDSFPALRPHQRAAWHMFLAQLGALALHRADETRPPQEAPAWAELLLALTDGAREPWSLVVEDLSKPAFLQPPIPEGDIAVLKNIIATPDALDVLITAKNVDLKGAVALDAEADDWLFALLSLQTMQGYSGKSKYGIARMNGGFSSRPFLGLAPAGGMGAHVRRDIGAMLAGRDMLLERHPDYAEDGIALLWLESWTGTTSLPLSRLDPWFIEVCRRIRLARDGESIFAREVGTDAARIDAKALNGVTGDFWAPVNAAEMKALTVDGRGFSYRVLCRILFGDGKGLAFHLPPALTPLGGERDMVLVARGLTRGQGETDGYHERIVPVKSATLQAFANPDLRLRLGELSEIQQKEIGHIASALRFACAIVATGGGSDKPSKDDYEHAAPFVQTLEAEAEADFFTTLQDRHAQVEGARISYLRGLIDRAGSLLGEACESIPCASHNRWRARVRAPGAFRGALWKGPLVNDRTVIFPKTETEDA